MSATETIPTRATPTTTTTTTTTTTEPTLVRTLPITTTPSNPFSTSIPPASSPSSQPPPPNPGLPGLKRGIGIGVGVCLFLIIIIVVAILAYRHRKKTKAASSSPPTPDPETGLLKLSMNSPAYEKRTQVGALALTEPDSTPVHEMPVLQGDGERVGDLTGRERYVSELMGDETKGELAIERIHELDATEAEVWRISEEGKTGRGARDRRSGNPDTEWKEVYLNFGR